MGRRTAVAAQAVALVVALVLAVVVVWSAPGWASWGGTGTGTATARATSLAAPTLGQLTFTCQNQNRASATIAWSAVPNATGYRIEFATNSAFSPTFSLKTTTSALTVQSDEFDPPQDVWVSVRATRSAWTSTAAQTTGLSCSR